MCISIHNIYAEYMCVYIATILVCTFDQIFLNNIRNSRVELNILGERNRQCGDIKPVVVYPVLVCVCVSVAWDTQSGN